MKKIPSLFERESDNRLAVNKVNPACQWVIDGEGVPTAKLDGTACAVIDGKLYKRYDNSRRKGEIRVQTTEPLDDWIHCQDTSERGQFIYWVPVGNKDYYHQIAWGWAQGKLDDGTYELLGPEVQGNPHGFFRNVLVKHGSVRLLKDLRTFDGIGGYLRDLPFEGIVWHHPDGRMAKITKAKFGFEWGGR